MLFEIHTLWLMRYMDYDEVMATLSPSAAVDALRDELKGGFEPANDQERQKVALPHGEMQLLPAATEGAVGVKVLGIQPVGSDVDVPFVQGSYLLMGGKTLTPQAVIDAAALTELRTPAVSVACVVDLLRGSSKSLNVAIFGTGVQGVGHAKTIADVCDGVREVTFTFISRNQPSDFPYEWVESGTSAADEAVSKADVVVTATSSPEPILGAENLRDDVIVLAVGSHTTDTRELFEDVFADAQVVVEDPGAAEREAGDVCIAIEKGVVTWDSLIPMVDVARGVVELDPSRRVVVKTVGMPWQDLAVARALTQQ